MSYGKHPWSGWRSLLRIFSSRKLSQLSLSFLPSIQSFCCQRHVSCGDPMAFRRAERSPHPFHNVRDAVIKQYSRSKKEGNCNLRLPLAVKPSRLPETTLSTSCRQVWLAEQQTRSHTALSPMNRQSLHHRLQLATTHAPVT